MSEIDYSDLSKKDQSISLEEIGSNSGQSKNLPETDIRVIFPNNHERNVVHRYPNNFVRTSKYTIITFLPKYLFEQFMRIANVYFLLISGLQQIPNISPTGRWTTLGTLIVVLTFTAIKEIFEDLKRHAQDREVNNRLVSVLRNNGFANIPWKDVQVGDIVKVVNRSYIPADLVLISTSEPQGLCYIETANLDGETNLKSRQAIPETQHFTEDSSLVDGLHGTVLKCEPPNNRIYHFDGSLEVKGHVYSLEVKQTVLRGAMLRNTKWIYGVVSYTGHETKLMKNANAAPVKRTNVERVANFQILFMFGLLLLMALLSAIGYGLWQASYSSGSWYLQFETNAAAGAALSFITFVILYNNLIPISLYVSVEIVKFGQAYFINNDAKMYDPVSNTPALARTSNLNEELGQVEYIFSDKTGTLTCNKMEFRKFSVAGSTFGTMGGPSAEDDVHVVKFNEEVPKDTEFEWTDQKLFETLRSNSEAGDIMKEALMLLAVCHTVIPEDDKDNNVTYQASSPDEAALVKAAKFFGFYFYKRTPKSVTVNLEGVDVEYRLLHTLEFTNDRKRMSVIVQDEKGRIILYCKGADTVIYERLATNNNPYVDITRKHLDEFAAEGLRTLCLSKVELKPEEYEEWARIYHAAATKIGNREKELHNAAELIEKNLILLGATAVEDQLQKGVPETIATLAKAGIKIWVLTGDKQETAINIGYSCRLLTNSMDLIIINKDTAQATGDKIDQYLEKYNDIDDESETLALIIDGNTLQYALADEMKLRLLTLAKKCKAVICCRVSPGQKAAIVKLVKNNLNAITLAIGDGANDVSMIQAAHVGVGISGEEGLQAARASDYAIAQFRFLQRLLLVHGRSSYRKISKLILYSFYKNIVLYFTQFWFTFFSGFSGQSLFERWTLSMYNVLFTLVPIILFGLLDKDVSDKSMEKFPELYMSGIRKYHFNIRNFWGWVFNAIFHSFIIFAIPTLAFEHGVIRENGQIVGLWTVGTVIYTCVVLVVSLKLALEARYWSWLFQLGLWGSVLVWLLWLLIYGVFFLIQFLEFGADLLYVPHNFFSSPMFYFVILLVPVVVLYRDYAWKYLYRTYFVRPYHIIQELEYLQKNNKYDDASQPLSFDSIEAVGRQ